jgi:hypothetical protein
MPNCGGNNELRLEGINDESHLQFALQTVQNYSISLSGVQSVNRPKISKQFYAFRLLVELFGAVYRLCTNGMRSEN